MDGWVRPATFAARKSPTGLKIFDSAHETIENFAVVTEIPPPGGVVA